jgi:RNA polymerase-binding protein DksA
VAKKAQPNKAGKLDNRGPSSVAKKAISRLSKEAPKALRPDAAPRLTKSPLSKAELKEFRQMLLDKRRALVGDMSGMAAEALRTNRQEGTGDLSKVPTHDADVGTDNFEQEFTLGLLESERILLAEINEAMERIDKGTFGICLGTGGPIDAARLKARPWAKYCIEYARMLEKGLVRPRSEEDKPFRELNDQDDGAEEAENLEEVETEPEDLPEEEKPSED